ncbi:MAG TPA: hypothetical protein DFR83_02990 [Deltaproteobacteria bacterium]|nr:hypothetical protein [Deltaproteobacteria bacterium]
MRFQASRAVYRNNAHHCAHQSFGVFVEQRKNRIAVGGLRKANPNHLTILVEDVLRSPLGQLDPRTLADLVALSEIPTQIPTQLAKQLVSFRERMMREASDLPDGPALADLLRDLAGVAPHAQPRTLRDSIREICADRKHEDVVPAFEALERHWATEEPIEIELPKAPAPEPKRAAAPVKPRRASGGSAKNGAGRPEPVHELLPSAAKPRRRVATSQVNDSRREDWMREDVLSRLENYGSRGLKQEIIVAGTRHRSPYSDLGEGEVLAILRKMKREGRVRFSAGRWMLNK